MKHFTLKTFHCEEQRNISFVSQRTPTFFKAIRLDECKDVFNTGLRNFIEVCTQSKFSVIKFYNRVSKTML